MAVVIRLGGRGVPDPAVIITGDCREAMLDLRCGSVQTVCTSPPYYGLRDFQHQQQVGAEASHTEYVQALVEIMRSVRVLLRNSGTVWLNMGDAYTRNGGVGKPGPNAKVGNTRRRIQRRNLRAPERLGAKKSSFSRCRGALRWRSKTTAGSSRAISSGTSPTPCPSPCATGRHARMSTCFCLLSNLISGMMHLLLMGQSGPYRHSDPRSAGFLQPSRRRWRRSAYELARVCVTRSWTHSAAPAQSVRSAGSSIGSSSASRSTTSTRRRRGTGLAQHDHRR